MNDLGLVLNQFSPFGRLVARMSPADFDVMIDEIKRLVAVARTEGAPHEALELRDALKFYARREHWMALTDDADSLRTHLVAMKGDGEQHGWRVAEDALELPSHD